MKKIYFITLAYLFLSLSSNAQSTYYKMLKEDTTTWQHWGFILGVSPSGKSVNYNPSPQHNSVAAIDSITIGGKLYKKLYHLWTPAYLNYSNKQLIGYIREDTIAKKVFFTPSFTTTEQVLYNFSLNVNDTTYIGFPYNSWLNGYFKVDSIKVKNILAGNRKHFYLRNYINNNQPNVNYIEIIEGIGSTYHLLYNYGGGFYQGMFSTTPQCYYPWEYGLSCKHDDNIQQFQSCTYSAGGWYQYADQCNYSTVTGNLKSNDWDRYIKVGPNPADDKLQITIDQNFENIVLTITDVSGRPISDIAKRSLGQNEYELNTRNLANGIYILTIGLNETAITRPFIIQH